MKVSENTTSNCARFSYVNSIRVELALCMITQKNKMLVCSNHSLNCHIILYLNVRKLMFVKNSSNQEEWFTKTEVLYQNDSEKWQ